MTAAPPLKPEVSPCTHYQGPFERLVVTVEGDFLACEDCALAQDFAGDMLTRAEWDAHEDVRAALAAFGIDDYTADKAGLAPTLRPRAHVWTVTTGGQRLVLKRRDQAPSEATIRLEGALRQHLADAHLPVAPFRMTSDGEILWNGGDARAWTVYPAPRGAPFPTNVLLWNSSGGIGGILAQMHDALQPLVATGVPPSEWECWTMDRLRAQMAEWPKLPQLTAELRDQAVEQLETRRTFAVLPTLPQTIAHGNFGRAAVFWNGSAPVGICEFDRMHQGPALCDFAMGLVSQFRPIVRAAVKAYDKERKLAPEECEALPEVLLLGTLIRVDRQLKVWHDRAAADQYASAIAHLLAKADTLRHL
jgi:Ser/Thr protein kinase RdoA (MazF antagonist)